MQKKIRKTEKHDRLSVSGTFATGASFRFSVSRTGERIEWAGSNDTTENNAQLQTFAEFCKFLPGENNAQRINRIHDTAQLANNAKEFAALMNNHHDPSGTRPPSGTGT